MTLHRVRVTNRPLYRTRKWIRSWVCLGLLTILMTSSVLWAEPTKTPLQAQTILKDLELADTDAQRLLAGEIISGDLQEGSRKEIAISIAMFVRAPLQEVFDAAHSARTLEAARNIIMFRDLGDQTPTEQSFAELGYTSDDTLDLFLLAQAEPGFRFNLAPSEILQLREVGNKFGTRGAGTDPTVRNHVNATYRTILLSRYRAYLEGGIRVIGSYDRGGGDTVWPGRELATAAAKMLLPDYAPDFYRAFIDYPQNTSSDIEHSFYWIKQRIGDRPGFVLAHRLFQRKPGYALMAERQFYVGHSYNTRQIIVGCLPVEEGTMVFYTNRTSTDRVDVESVSDILHEMGRRQLRNQVTEHLDSIRQSLQQQTRSD